MFDFPQSLQSLFMLILTSVQHGPVGVFISALVLSPRKPGDPRSLFHWLAHLVCVLSHPGVESSVSKEPSSCERLMVFGTTVSVLNAQCYRGISASAREREFYLSEKKKNHIYIDIPISNVSLWGFYLLVFEFKHMFTLSLKVLVFNIVLIT